MTTALTVRELPRESNPYRFETGLPIIGTIDFNSPLEWIWWGGLAADLLLISGASKWIIAAGILVARSEVNKRCGI